MPGFLHLYSGEEAIAVGVMVGAPTPDDYISTQPSRPRPLIAKGGDTKRMFAELFGKATGYCKGKGGSMHIADMAHGILGANGIVGAAVPIGTGAAFAAKYRGERPVSVCFFGDALHQPGHVPRGPQPGRHLGAAGRLRRARTTSTAWPTASRDYMKTERHGRPRRRATASPEWSSTATTCSPSMRRRPRRSSGRAAGGGPTLIECKTWRHWGHFIGDMATYRDPAEHEAWLKRDPIPAFAGSARSRRGAGRPRPSSRPIQDEADAEMHAAVEFGKASPFPDCRRIDHRRLCRVRGQA